jgi:hypothetical protein
MSRKLAAEFVGTSLRPGWSAVKHLGCWRDESSHLRHPLEHLAKGIALTFLPRPAERRSIGDLFLDAELAKLPGQIHLALSASLSSAKGVWLLKTSTARRYAFVYHRSPPYSRRDAAQLQGGFG